MLTLTAALNFLVERDFAVAPSGILYVGVGVALLGIGLASAVLFRERSRRTQLKITQSRRLDAKAFVGGYNAGGFTKYLPIPQDAEIKEALLAGEDIILLGRPGIGKSHTAIHHISTLFPTWQVITPSKDAIHRLMFVHLPKKRYILFLDDLNEFIAALSGGESIIDLVQQVQSRAKEVRVIATMRSTRPHFDIIDSDSKSLGRWRSIELSDWSRTQGAALARITKKSMESWDGTPLSVKQPSSELLQRYIIAPYGEKALVRSLKFLHSLGVKPCSRDSLRLVYESDLFSGSDMPFEVALDAIDRAGFLKSATLTIEAYTPYTEAVTDWIFSDAEYLLIKKLFLVAGSREELLMIGSRWYEEGDLREAEELFRECILLEPTDARVHYKLGVLLSREKRWEEAVECFEQVEKLTPAWPTPSFRLSRAYEALGDEQKARAAVARGQLATLRSRPHLVGSTAGLRLARLLAVVGKRKEAVETYRSYIESNPDSAEAYLGLGIALKSSGDWSNAEGAFRKAAELDPTSFFAYSYLGAVLTRTGRLVESVKAYTRALELDPNAAITQFGLGLALRSLGEYKAAETAFRRAAELRPDHALATAFIGIALTDQGHVDEGRTAFQAAAHAHPNLADAFMRFAFSLRAKQDSPGAVEAFQYAVQLDPTSWMAWSYLGRELSHQQRNRDALEAYKRALELNFAVPELHLGYGVTARKSGDNNTAEAAFRTAIHLRPDFAIAYSYLAHVLWDAEQKEEALDAHRLAAEIAPGDPKIQFGYAVTLQKMGDLQGAVTRFRTAVDLHHEFHLARLGLATVLDQLGRHEEAAECAAEGLAMLDADSSPEGYYQYGFLLRELNRPNAAERAFRAAITLNPKYALAYSHLGGMLGDLGRWDESVEVQERAVSLGLRTADAYFGLGYALRMTGQLARAETAYRESIAIDPHYSLAYSHLGGVLGDLGRWEESREVQIQAIDLGENTPSAHYGLGFANYKLRRWIEAEEHLGIATRLDNGHAWAFSYLGGALLNLGRIGDAIDACLKAIQLKDDNPTFYFTLGLAYRKKRDLTSAERAFRRATELNPEFALAWSYLGAVRGLLGLWDQAVEACKAAVSLNPSKAEIRFGLGRALFYAGLASAAREYRTALDLKPAHSFARQELERIQLLFPSQSESDQT